MQEWKIEAGGVAHTVRAEEGPGGKIFVRSNGRMIAQPLGPADQERLFTIGTEAFRLYRTEAGLELEPLVVVTEPAEVEVDARERRVMPLGLRSRVYFALAFVIFLGSSCAGLSVASFRDRMSRAISAMPGGTEAEDRSLERANAIATLISSGFTWQAFLAFLGFVGAAALARGARWAPRFLEIVTWAMLLIAFFALARIDRVLHMHMYAALPPLTAAEMMAKYHRAGLFLLIVAALAVGGLLQLIRSDITSEQVEDEI